MSLSRTVVLAVSLWLARAARAEHTHGPSPGSAEPGAASTLAAGISMFAARYDQRLYEGNYQGVAPIVRWANARLAITGTFPLYRLVENGRTLYGPGDGVLAAQVSHQRAALRAGLVAAVSVPTGDHQTGFGMGHAMVMSSLFAAYALDLVTVGASAGYGRAFGGGAHEHDRGSWPIVDPMNRSEVLWSATADVALAHAVMTGARVMGAIPIGDGNSRVIAAARVGWTAGRVATGFELQAGLAGDPFSVRGVVETTLRF
ncbi:MAG: hypothetical protein WKG01_14775 [Kofleriaceae bacterium]